MRCFCTVVTANYLPYALALYDSIQEFDKTVKLHVLVSDVESLKENVQHDNVEIDFYPKLCESGLGKTIKERYHESYHDAFRWSMKSVYMLHLLNAHQEVIYVDCDIQFASDFEFLFQELADHNVLLSPHFRSSNPTIDKANFLMQFYSGLFNGGFVGANKNGIPALEWWGHACSNICEINPSKGQYVDQSHLNLLPIFFDGIKIIKHRGCNLANWNRLECKRSLVEEKVMINEKYPVVFIHFTPSTMRGILTGDDALLRPYLDRYDERLTAFGLSKSLIDQYQNEHVNRKSKIPGKLKKLFKG